MKKFRFLMVSLLACSVMACGSDGGENYLDTNWQEIYEANKDKTVLITSYYDDGNVKEGSGFFIKDNVIVTNYHVVMPVYLSSVQVTTIDGYTYWITEMDVSLENRDIAFLKFPGKKEPVSLGTIDSLNILDEVMHIGNPVDLYWSASKGAVSATRKAADIDNKLVDGDTDIIQTDISSDHGSSGGVLFDTNGDVVAVMFNGYDLEEASGEFWFGISIDYVKERLPYLDFQSMEELQITPEVAFMGGEWHISYTIESEYEEIYTFYLISIENYKSEDIDYIIWGEDDMENEISCIFNSELQKFRILDEESIYYKVFSFELDPDGTTITDGRLIYEEDDGTSTTYEITGYKETP